MSPLSNIKFLIVEDEPLLCEAICEIFANEGAIVDQAENGVVAFSKVSEKNYDVVISDIKMPKGSGLELMKKINSLGGKLPLCFFLTGSYSGTNENLLALGVQKAFQKPFSAKKVVAEISLALEQAKLIPGASETKHN